MNEPVLRAQCQDMESIEPQSHSDPGTSIYMTSSSPAWIGSRSCSRSRSRSRSPEAERPSASPSETEKPAESAPKAVKLVQDETLEPSRVLGAFGLSLFTQPEDLEDLFGKYGVVERVDVIRDRATGKSRGYAFVYFEKIDDALIAREKLNGCTLKERQMRVDFSRTGRPHEPTPGFYQGRPTSEIHAERRDRERGRGRDRDHDRDYHSRDRGYDRDRDFRGRDRERRVRPGDEGERFYRPVNASNRSRSRSRERNARPSHRSDYRRNDRSRSSERHSNGRSYEARRSVSPRRY